MKWLLTFIFGTTLVFVLFACIQVVTPTPTPIYVPITPTPRPTLSIPATPTASEIADAILIMGVAETLMEDLVGSSASCQHRIRPNGVIDLVFYCWASASEPLILMSTLNVSKMNGDYRMEAYVVREAESELFDIMHCISLDPDAEPSCSQEFTSDDSAPATGIATLLSKFTAMLDPEYKE